MSKIHCKYDELVNPKDLLDHPKNRNKHNGDQIERLASMYSYHGIRHPIIVSKLSGYIVAGHGRKQAAIKAGLETFPVVYQEFETPEHEYAFLQADNAIALWAELDIAGIQVDSMELSTEFNVEMLGIKDFELPNVTKENADPDEVTEPPKEPRSKLGDLYELGNHRLLCGDSTSITDVERLMNGEKADLTFTSPPYNGNTHLSDGDVFANKAKKLYSDGYSDNLSSEQYIDFASQVLENCFIYTEGFIFWNVNYNANSRSEFIKQIINRLDFLIETICWKKHHAIPFTGSLMRQWEPIFVFSTDKSTLGISKATVNHWDIGNRNVQEKNHKACFPVELPEKGIGLISKKTGIVFEPFCGSGSTLIASEKTGRKCYGIELDPHYIDVIVSRYVKFTGKNKIKLNGEPIEWSLDG